MATEYITRMGDGRKVTMTKEEILADIEAGVAEAVESAEVPELSGDEVDHLLEIIASKEKLVTVEHGKEVILSLDGGSISIESEHGSGIPCGRINGVIMEERAYCLDILELAHMDYSYKPVKPLTAVECQTMRQLQEFTTAPLLYGAMPNMGLYYTPDGPYENPGDLMKAFKIREAQESIEKSAEHLTRDMIWIIQKMMKNGGTDGANFDTTAAAGDGDFYATLKAIEALRKEFPEMYIEAGMASETVLGIHGELEYDGVNVAGLWPHKQVELIEKAGANVFGPVCNTNTTYSFAWNLARAVTVVKACSETATVPIHVNMGNGVGGIPMFEIPSTDTISRADKAMIEIANVDGI